MPCAREKIRVSAQVAHNHHVVPQVFLKGFAAGAHLCEHRRDGSTSKVTVKKAAVVPDFYLTTSGTTTDDALEEWLGKNVESPAADIVKALRKGKVPEGPARATAGTFLAFQMVRGPALRRRLQEVGEHLRTLLFGVKATGQVVKKMPGWKPDDEVLQAMVARAAEYAPDDIGQASVAADLRTMVREADRLRGLLVDMHWSVCTSTADFLIVGDTPAVALDLVDGFDALPDRFEVVMPLSPRCLLVVSPYPALGSGTGVLTVGVVPPESWRASLCGFPVGGRGVLVVDRAHHACRAVPALVVVEAVAPVQHDGLGLAGVVELVA